MFEFRTRMRVYLLVIVVAVLAVAAYWAGSQWADRSSAALANSKDQAVSEGADAQQKDEQESVPVQLASAEIGGISSYLSATANLRPLRQVEVVGQAEGLAMEVTAEEGDFVRAGQVLARLDDSQLQIRLRSAQQKLAQSELQLEKAKIRREKAATQISNTREELDRYQSLYEEELVSEREVAQLRYRLEELQHDERVSSHETRELSHRVAELLAEIDEVQLQLRQTTVKAPFEGHITRRSVQKGQMVRKLDQLYELGSFSSLFADVFLSEKDARLVKPGQTAVLTLGSDASLRTEGRVLRISPVVDEATGTVKVTVELSGRDSGFKPGAFVRVGIETDSHSGSVLIPKRAVIEEDGQHFVFVVESGKARRLEVTLGYENGGKTEVLRGLRGGESVVVAGQGALKDSSSVKVIEG